MPTFDAMDDEALTTWLVSALLEAQRRGLTTVLMAEPATAEALVREAGPETEDAGGGPTPKRRLVH